MCGTRHNRKGCAVHHVYTNAKLYIFFEVKNKMSNFASIRFLSINCAALSAALTKKI